MNSQLRAMPKRIQRQRTLGWRMPQNTRYIGRGSIYDNPFLVTVFGRDLAIELYERSIHGSWTANGIPDNLVDVAYQGFQEILLVHQSLNTTLAHWAEIDLAGVNVCCWCPEDVRCHGDVLLRIGRKRTKEAFQ